MFFKHSAFVDPENDTLKLWRYIELEKFILLIESSELYFCRADYFHKEDPFEGTFPRIEYENQLKQYGAEFIRNIFKISSKDTFLNCWHLNEEENLAMWKLYSKNNKGVAIQTDIQSFKDAFENSDRDIFAGEVQYIDYEKDYFYGRSGYNYQWMNTFSAYIHKRIIYDYEKEYRAICTDPKRKEKNGINIKVILNKLIKKVYLAPNTATDHFNIIKDTINNYSSNIEVCYSSYDAKPYY